MRDMRHAVAGAPPINGPHCLPACANYLNAHSQPASGLMQRAPATFNRHSRSQDELQPTPAQRAQQHSQVPSNSQQIIRNWALVPPPAKTA